MFTSCKNGSLKRDQRPCMPSFYPQLAVMYPASSTVVEDASVLRSQDRSCTVVDGTGAPCGETESLNILSEFQRLYETRVESVDRQTDGEFERASMKLQIMKEWIKDLGEQNIMLVHTVEDLEQAASSRVKLLEDKLRQSSMLISDNISKSSSTEEAIKLLSHRIGELEKDEEYMQQRIEFLQSDIRGLLELIRRARQNNCWDMDGIEFFDIQPSDIPVPLDCSCGQEETNEKMQSLKLQVEQLQENERKMIAYQTELEAKVADLSTKLFTNEKSLKKYDSQFQSLGDNLKRYSKSPERVICNSFMEKDEIESPDIVLMADIVENVLVEKDLEARSLRERLRDANNLRSAELNDVQLRMSALEKESLETREVLTAEVAEKHDAIMSLRKEVATLEERCRNANMRMHFKEDIIREMRRELKQMAVKDDTGLSSGKIQQAGIMSHLINVKSVIEKEKEALSDMKIHLEELCYNKEEECGHDTMNIYKKFEDIEILLNNYKSQIIDNPDCASELKNCIAALELPLSCLQHMFQSIFLTGRVNELDKKNITQKIVANIDLIAKLHSEKEQALEAINSMTHADDNSGYKVMDTFKECGAEVEAATDEIREEIGVAISTFNSQYQQFTELNQVVANVQDQLTTTRERLTETINRLQLQEDERIRHSERLSAGKLKLKDIKNEINHAQSRLSSRVFDTHESVQEHTMSSYTEACICNDLLSLVLEEMEQILSNFTFQAQGCCVTSTLGELKSQLYEVDSSIKGLQRKMDEVLLENDVTEIFFEGEQKLEKLEADVDCACTKVQSALLSTIGMNGQRRDQTLSEVRRPKRSERLRKEYDELKQKTSRKISYTECNEKMCQWKCRVVDLQDQVRLLKHEVKCKQEANHFLRSNIEAMEEELRSVQAKAENYRRSNSVSSMELKKKIIELENTIKMQKETESTLRQHLNDSELELKRSKDLLNSFHNEHGVDGMLLHYGSNQFKNEAMNIPQLFQTLQSAMQNMKRDLHDLAHELKKLICEGTPHSCSSTRSLMTLIDKLEKYEAEMDNCSQEVAKLKNVLYSKDKLLENMDEIIKIQKDSITMTQAELKEVHHKLQEKIDVQDRIIDQYEKDKTELLKQNELQVQTIGHLQSAVVEAKKSIDHMEQKMITDLLEKIETVRALTIRADETQSQYSECFAEAAKQDGLMELQRDAITELHEKIYDLERDKREQLEVRVNEFQAAKCKIDALVRSNGCWETKYLSARKSCQEKEEELQELKKTALRSEREKKTYSEKTCQCEVEVVDKDCLTDDLEWSNVEEEFGGSSRERELQSEIDALIKENEDVKGQLQRWKLDIDIIGKELKIDREDDDHAEHFAAELQRIKRNECCLRSENEQLKFDLENRTRDTEDLLQQINHSYGEIACKTAITRQQGETIEDLHEKLDLSQELTRKYVSDLNSMENMRTALCDRLDSLKALLKEKSDHVVKLQADYEMLRNDYSISKTENSIVENRAKEDVLQLKKKLKEVQLELCFAEDNYRSVTQDFNKTQEQLVQAANREADLQESLTNIEKDCSSKIMCAGKEEAKLRNLVDKLTDEVEDVQRNYTLRNSELCRAQEVCNSYAEEIEAMQHRNKREKERAVKVEDSNRRLIQQLQECIEQNCTLVQEKTLVEENSSKIVAELEEMHRSLLDLKKECQLKNKSLACISAELTETAMSRSELCNESQYVVACIRVYMEEQEKHVENLVSKLKFKQQQLIQLCFEKKALLVNIRELRRVNNLLTQRLKRTCRAGRGIKNVCAGCYLIPSMPQNAGTRVSPLPNYQRSHRKCTVGPIKTSRRTSICGNPWWFPKMEYLTNELHKNNMWCNENFCEESRDCGYQSSNSK